MCPLWVTMLDLLHRFSHRYQNERTFSFFSRTRSTYVQTYVCQTLSQNSPLIFKRPLEICDLFIHSTIILLLFDRITVYSVSSFQQPQF